MFCVIGECHRTLLAAVIREWRPPLTVGYLWRAEWYLLPAAPLVTAAELDGVAL